MALLAAIGLFVNKTFFCLPVHKSLDVVIYVSTRYTLLICVLKKRNSQWICSAFQRRSQCNGDPEKFNICAVQSEVIFDPWSSGPNCWSVGIFTNGTNRVSLTEWTILVQRTNQITVNKYDPRVVHFQR